MKMQWSWNLETYKNVTNVIYKNAVQNFIIKRLLLFSLSKRLRIKVLRVLQKLEYKFLTKNYS